MGRLSDLVHGGAVVSIGHKDFLGGRQQLGASFVTREPRRTRTAGPRLSRGCLPGLCPINRCMMNHCWPSFDCSYLHFTRG
jgi:hypothetical protein